jgi:hypothetical protein
MSDVWSYMSVGGVRLMSSSDAFLSEGDAACAVRRHVYLTQTDAEELLHNDLKPFPCSVQG